MRGGQGDLAEDVEGEGQAWGPSCGRGGCVEGTGPSYGRRG